VKSKNAAKRVFVVFRVFFPAIPSGAFQFIVAFGADVRCKYLFVLPFVSFCISCFPPL